MLAELKAALILPVYLARGQRRTRRAAILGVPAQKRERVGSVNPARQEEIDRDRTRPSSGRQS